MKRIINAIALFLAISFGAHGQGEINFANGAPGLDAPVLDSAGVALARGSGYLADLFYAADPGATSIALADMTDAGYAVSIAPVADGLFLGGVKTLPISGDIEFQVVVWQASAGASWAAATGGGAGDAATYGANGGTFWGYSDQFQLNPNVAPTPFSNLVGLTPFGVGLTSFQLQATPEPMTYALGGLGAAALLLFRRRK